MNRHGILGGFVCTILLAGFFVWGCGDSSSILNRFYTGTAGVGDFLQITLDPLGETIKYVNISNGDCDTINYAMQMDGFYSVTDGDNPDYPLTGVPECVSDDPTGNVVDALEIPGFAMLMHLAKAGPSSDMDSLVFSVQRQPILQVVASGETYNHMQFRTSGGIEVGTFSLDTATGNFSNEFFWPYALVSGQGGLEFQGGTSMAGSLTLDPSGTYYVVDDGSMSYSYAFGTSSGMLLVDNPNGAIIAFRQTATQNFNPFQAGTYKGLIYHKTGVTPMGGGDSGGTLSIYKSTITVAVNAANGDGDGNPDNLDLTVENDDAMSTTLSTTTLDAVADQVYLQGMNKLTDPMNGVFTKRTINSTVTEDVFVTFVGKAMLILYFKDTDNTTDNNSYDYFYGMALQQ